MKRTVILQLSFALALLPAALAQTASLVEASAKATQDLQSSLKRLAEVRATVAAEEPQISADFNKVESELREKRRLARLARTAVDDRRELMRELESTHYSLHQDASSLSSMLKDHALKLETQSITGMPPLDVPADVIVAGPGTEAAALLRARGAVLTASMNRLAALFGGSTTPGQAVALDGSVQEGTFVALGPESWFSAQDGSVGGPVEPGKNGSVPRILPGDPTAAAQLIAGKETFVEIDFTGGKARLVQESTHFGIRESIEAGGFWVWPILVLGMLSFSFGAFKMLQFSTIRHPGVTWMDAIVRAVADGHRAQAEELATKTRHPAGQVIAKAIRVSNLGRETIEETIYEALIGVKAWSGSLLPLIAVTAATAPLLGLLGTVSGMIQTFQMITVVGSGDPKPLAGGISEALTATAWGLIVAIPSLLLHAYLTRQSQNIVQSSEQMGLVFVNSLRN